MIIYVDIDNTICRTPEGMDYKSVQPYPERIARINKLYDEGHVIVYYTARGVLTGKNWKEITEEQFNRWGVKYHELRLDKPAFDLLIDDKTVHPDTFFMEE